MKLWELFLSKYLPFMRMCARYKFSTCKRYTSMYERTRSRVCLHVCTYSPRSPRAKKSMNVSKDGVSEVQVKARKYRT